MPEITTPAKVVFVEMECNECFAGMMERLGNEVLTSYPPKYPHKCSNCGHRENFETVYPTYRFVKDE